MADSNYGALSMMEEEEVEEDASKLEKLLAHKYVKLTLFIIMVLYGLFGVIFDWLWVADTLSTETALVFGPPGTDIVVTLIVVASLGTMVFALEITNLCMKNFCGKPLMPEELAELITIFVEEVPQVTLNALLASCREVPMSYYQLVKAALAMFGSIFRSIKVLCHYFTVRRRDKETGCWRWLVRTLILCACVYIMIASCLVWVFTYSETTPENVYTKSYNDERYLYKSGVYFSHPVLASCNNNTMAWNDTQHNWLRMEGIYEVQDSVDYQFNFYVHTSHVISHAHTSFPDHTNEVCYVTALPDCITRAATVASSCQDLDSSLNFQQMISIKMGSKESSKTRVFGDITYKALIRENNICEHMYVDHVGFFRKPSSADVHAMFQYMRVFEHINDTHPFYTDDPTQLRPYIYQYDTQNVTDVWLTGYNECDMTGSMCPNLDDKLNLHC